MARDKDRYHEFSVEALKYSSQKAFLFQLTGIPEPVWVPRSQCDYDEDTSVVHISEWLIKQKPELDEFMRGPGATD